MTARCTLLILSRDYSASRVSGELSVILRWIVMVVGYFFSFSYSSDNSLSPSVVGCLHVQCTCLIGFAIISVVGEVWYTCSYCKQKLKEFPH